MTVEAQLTAVFFTPTTEVLKPTENPTAELEASVQASATPAITSTLYEIPAFTETETVTPEEIFTATSTAIQTNPNVETSDPRDNLGEPDFIDSFDSSVNWALTNDNFINMAIREGQLNLTAYQPGLYNGWGFSWPNLENFYLEIRTSAQVPCGGRDRYGVIFRAPDVYRGYLLGFSCAGEYALWYWNGDREISIIGWTESSAILNGPNQENRLGIKAQGDHLAIYANGVLLQDLLDSTNLEGYFGLFIGAGQTVGFSIKVDSLEYWVLD
jgi:hypothetical protein